MRYFTLIAASALAAFVSAQSSTSTTSGTASTSATAVVTTAAATTTGGAVPSTQSQSMPPSATAGFNINNVTDTEKTDWCRAQRNSCREICGGGPAVDDCTEATLTYSCTCYNGTVPDMTRYTETLPYFICIATRDQCIANHPDDQAGQDTCKATAQCGTIEPPEVAAATTTSSSASGSAASSSGSATSTTHTSSTSNAAVIHNTELTTGAFAALLMAFFKLLL